MKRILLPTVLIASAVGLAAPASTQHTASQLVGVWKMQKFDRCKAGTNECIPFYGEKPGGYLVYSKSGVFLSQGYGDKRPMPKGPDPTDEERVALHRSMFAWGGKYKVEGDKLSTTVEVSWQASWVGSVRSSTFKITGNNLEVTSTPFKSTVDGAMIVTKLTLERVE